jgi:Mn2+/Fe2+ NRAMP family transporter
MTTLDLRNRSAVIDSEHVGDIRGALGTIRLDDTAPRRGRSAVLKTLLAIVGPGLIVMVGDNDAGAFATYGQAGQNYGTKLLWTLLLLVPVLYVNQEMVLRLGAVTGVGHARLILERFGKFWGAFSVIDLFILNALTIVTEFIGITLAAGYLGVPKIAAVALAAAVVVGSAFTGSFRRFERIAVAFCAGSLLLIPLYFMAHPHVSQMAHDFVLPQLPGGGGQLSTVMLLIIGIVGTTVAPWQLFFQQSYVIDKRITPRFMKYEKADLGIGIVIVIVGGAALMGATAVAFAHTHGFGQFSDTAGLARRRAVRDRPAGRLHHRRIRGLTLHCLRHQRRVRLQPLLASRGEARQGLLRHLRRADRRSGDNRADPRLAARPAHRRRAGPGRGAAP